MGGTSDWDSLIPPQIEAVQVETTALRTKSALFSAYILEGEVGSGQPEGGAIAYIRKGDYIGELWAPAGESKLICGGGKVILSTKNKVCIPEVK